MNVILEVREVTPTESYRLCAWMNCRTYSHKAVQTNNGMVLVCNGHLNELIDFNGGES